MRMKCAHKGRAIWALGILLSTIWSSACLTAAVIYVDIDATGSNNGNSWNNAFTDLQDAIDDANYGDAIWVAQGTYYPGRDTLGNLNPANPQTKAFKLKNGVRIMGGFNGTEVSTSQRDWFINKSILSGDIGIVGDSTDNCYTVVFAINVDRETRLNGLIIRDGNDNDYPAEGPAVHAENSSLLILIGG